MRRPEGHPCLAMMLDWVMAPLGRLRPGVVGGAEGRVLEVGCGTGLNFEYYKPHASVDAIEPDPHMRQRAEQRVAGRNIRLHAAGAEAMPFADHTFDSVVVTFAFCTIPDVEASIREIRRVARPGAPIRFAEHVRSASAVVATGQSIVDPIWTRLSGGCHLDRDPARLLQDAGFTDLDIRPRGAGWSPLPVITGTAVAP
jgi:SAM-dependent methyltransferase